MDKSVKKKILEKTGCAVTRLQIKVESALTRTKRKAAAFFRSAAAHIRSQAAGMRAGLSRGKLVLCNTDGGILDVALEVAIGVVVGLLILLALKNLWGVNILPPVTSKVNSMVE